MTQYVVINRAAELTGLSPKAIRRKIESGVWLQNVLWKKAPDGRIYIDLKGFERWCEGAMK